MTLRQPGHIPPILDLARFLVASITFMTHLSEVSVYIDDKRLVRLSKDCNASKEVPVLNGLKGTSPQGMMNVKSIKSMCESCYSFRKNFMYPFFDSVPHRGGRGSMGVQYWLRKDFHCI